MIEINNLTIKITETSILKDVSLSISENKIVGLIAPNGTGKTTFLKSIAALICTRSARLVAATYIGIINHIDPELKHHHNIAIDGSLYEKMPGYGAEIQRTLTQDLGEKSSLVTTSLIKDGSGIGAAIATAIAEKM